MMNSNKIYTVAPSSFKASIYAVAIVDRKEGSDFKLCLTKLQLGCSRSIFDVNSLSKIVYSIDATDFVYESCLNLPESLYCLFVD